MTTSGSIPVDPERFPVDARTDDVRAALRDRNSCVFVAPPGSGKTTRVPLRLLDDEYLAGGRIVMLEPRRLAARMAARWMAKSIGQEVGRTVGYRTRMDSRAGRDTRLEVVTEGILTRMLQDDPSLDGVGLVVFDEFHERSLQADLALALALDARATLRDDLRVLVMSATIDAPRVARLLCAPAAPVVACDGKTFDVDTRYAPRPSRDRLEQRAARVVTRALAEESGSVLVFLPGEGEIRRTAKALRDGGLPGSVDLAPLYGALKREDQDRAVSPAPPGRRKVVLATSIAESSLTIEGIRIVIDAGKMRRPEHSALTGMTRLVTLPVSRASADQRRGRAGRLEEGVCFRLWTDAEDASLTAFTAPEVESADLTGLALELARWGAATPDGLAWMSPPPPAAFERGRDLLRQLGALGADGRITETGKRMLKLPVHPRLAHMILRARSDEEKALACDVSALLGERDVFASMGRDAPRDIRTRLDALGGARSRADRSALDRVRKTARDLRRRVGCGDRSVSADAAGRTLAMAYPDRVGRRRADAQGRYVMANGRGARVPAHDELARSEYLAVASLDGDGTEAGVYLAAPLGEEDVRELFADRLAAGDVVKWDRASGVVVARHELRLGAVALESHALANPPADLVAAALVEGIRERGIHVLPWDRDTRAWQSRVRFLHGVDPEAWPDVSDDALTEALAEWLAPFLAGMTKIGHLRGVKLQDALSSLVGWRRARDVDALAPTHVAVASGARVRVDYSGERPALPVQIQKMFGCTETPRIASGRVALVLHLLSPAQRPVQVTDDLVSFWKNAYPEIRKELRGRYPKHPWPEDPMSAQPTNRTKRKNG